MSDFNNTKQNTQNVGNMRTYNNNDELPEAIRPMQNPTGNMFQSQLGMNNYQPSPATKHPAMAVIESEGLVVDSVDVYLEIANKSHENVMGLDVTTLINTLFGLQSRPKIALRRDNVVFIRGNGYPNGYVILLPSGEEVTISHGDTVAISLLTIVSRGGENVEDDIIAFASAVDALVKVVKDVHAKNSETAVAEAK